MNSDHLDASKVRKASGIGSSATSASTQQMHSTTDVGPDAGAPETVYVQDLHVAMCCCTDELHAYSMYMCSAIDFMYTRSLL